MNFNDIPIINDKPIAEEDEVVRQQLKELGQPVFINGEDDQARRERLFILVNDAGFETSDIHSGEDDDEEDDDEEEDFYTPGPTNLYDARIRILNHSLGKASYRLQHQREMLQKIPQFTTILKKRRSINSKLSQIELCGSQVIQGNTRAVSSVRYSSSGDLIACGTWDGSVHVLNNNDLSPSGKLLGGQHAEKVGGLDWQAKDSQQRLISGGSDGTMNIWNITASDEVIKPKLSIKEAHTNRITKTLFHPIGDFALSTSFDQTWKLWDLNKVVELYQQEGHSKEIYSGAIHPDGSLFLSGGLDGVVYVWDLRSGRALMPLQKHMQGVYGLDWSLNGYHFASGSGDCSVKIWDMRKLDHSGEELFSIPAHTKLVSDVRFHSGNGVADEDGFNTNGSCLATSSYDGTVKIWSADNWILINTLKGHNEKVMSCDISDANNAINFVSGGWDRTVKLWQSPQ